MKRVENLVPESHAFPPSPVPFVDFMSIFVLRSDHKRTGTTFIGGGGGGGAFPPNIFFRRQRRNSRSAGAGSFMASWATQN